MKYIKYYKGTTQPFEITKEEAKSTLAGHWKPEFLDDIFDNEKVFRLDTPYSTVETRTDYGATPIPGFYGVCD